MFHVIASNVDACTQISALHMYRRTILIMLNNPTLEPLMIYWIEMNFEIYWVEIKFLIFPISINIPIRVISIQCVVCGIWRNDYSVELSRHHETLMVIVSADYGTRPDIWSLTLSIARYSVDTAPCKTCL